MKRTRFFTLLLALLLCVSVLCMTAYAESDAWDGRSSDAFADGDGSESNPYQIANGAQLYYLTLQSNTNHYYVLTDNINLGNKLFPMIASFSGTLDGQGFQISGLNVSVSESVENNAAGLIGICSGTVKNLEVSGSIKNTLARGYVGGIAGLLRSSGVIENCVNRCTIEATSSSSCAGGLAGYCEYLCKIILCKNYGDVHGYMAGGILGKSYDYCSNSNDPLSNVAFGCLNAGNITSTYTAGGICGHLEGRGISQCCNTGNVTATARGGGIIGYGYGTHYYINKKHSYYFSRIDNCFNTGTINASHAGGIAGSFTCYSTAYGQISYCYNVGILQSTEENSGEIIGFGKLSSNANDVIAKISNCVYLDGNNPDANYHQGTGHSSDELQTAGAYNGFDFSSIWGWDNTGSYPYAILQTVSLPEGPCEHNYALTSNTATCTDAGVATYTCSKCGDSYTEEAPPKGHTWVDATCTEPKTCSVCSATDGNPLGHDWNDWTVTTEATCTAKGEKTRSCKRDGCDATETVDIPANGHTEVTDAAVEPTCTEPGKSEGKHCSVCNAILVAQTEILAKGHTWTAASCTAPRTCSVCSATDGNPLGHDWNDWTVTTEATCTAKGEKTRSCKRDGCDATETVDIPANGHTEGKAVRENEVPASCSAAGSYDEVIYCSVCEEEISRTQKTIEKLPHDFSGNREYCANGCGTKNPNYTPPRRPSHGSQVKPTPTKPEKPKNPFKDVSENDYFYDAVLWAVDKDITSGTSATIFDANKNCTRAEMVTFLWRAVGKPEPTNRMNPFTDVKEDSYYYKAVLWAVENGITKGTSDTTFSPNDTCTRGQTATFLYRYAGSPAVSGRNYFNDVNETDYYYDAVVWAASEGITAGTSATTFSPADFCTRGQIVTFLYRYLKN